MTRQNKNKNTDSLFVDVLAALVIMGVFIGIQMIIHVFE